MAATMSDVTPSGRLPRLRARRQAGARAGREPRHRQPVASAPAATLPEIAFVKTLNAGKSTAINTLTQQRQLASPSKTPGRTQHINLFELGPRQRASPGPVRWQEVMARYLAERPQLRGVVLLVDARHGPTELDQQLLRFVAPRVGTGEVRLLVALTKADKLSRHEAQRSLRAAPSRWWVSS